MRLLSLPTLLATGFAAATLAISSQAIAYGAGDFFTRVGVAKVAPKSDNGSLAGGAFAVDVQDKTDFAFTLGYRFHDKLGVELLAALPFEHDIQLNGENLASTKHLPPTLTLQYYPLGGSDARVQPYVGAGINYTRFSDEQLAIGELDLDDSWGAAAQVGFDLLIDEHWALNAAAWYLDIDTDATVNGAAAGTVAIDPMVVMAGLSYRF
ncbi:MULTISPECIES: OmpW family outer membrane protein [unclassified Halomonas]|jgi:outer membrane protein|uniref:OmpW/AlkL family protein n=1 Tax=Halomonadaceae TaxID=28256 RepID=UPI001EF409EA|nr:MULTISPECIES: OmpW family outer membrane protein [unclassified Halomonas]MCG7590997.1 outer membrane beta-barrel protein [Halomonas sp. McD50-5]MCG7617109.1 outer membrane beta-barrel protein [Halomonas sp. McD50-4]BCB61822.1 outer membrane protein [Halomonas sp. A020]